MMRIKLVQQPPMSGIDGIRLDCFAVGQQYEVGNSLGSLLLAERWAEPVPLDAPTPAPPFSEADPFDCRILDRSDPPNLRKEYHPPYLGDREVAADFQWRRRPRFR